MAMKMSSVKLSIVGVEVEVSHPSLKLSKSKLPLDNTVSFRCSCGRRTLKVSESHIKSAGPEFGKIQSTPFLEVKNGIKVSKERAEFENDPTLDSIGYWQKHREWSAKNSLLFQNASANVETTIGVTCPLCSTWHQLRVKFGFPADVKPNWSFPSLTETFEKHGINNNEKSLDIITIVTRNREAPEAYLEELNGLKNDRQKIDVFVEGLIASVEKAKFDSKLAASWVRDLTAALKEEAEVAKRKLGSELNFYLEALKDSAEQESRMPKEPPKETSYVAGV
jgi:hypothetical protein